MASILLVTYNAMMRIMSKIVSHNTLFCDSVLFPFLGGWGGALFAIVSLKSYFKMKLLSDIKTKLSEKGLLIVPDDADGGDEDDGEEDDADQDGHQHMGQRGLQCAK